MLKKYCHEQKRVEVLDWNAVSESFKKVIEVKYIVIQKPLV